VENAWFAGIRSNRIKDDPLDQLKEALEAIAKKLGLQSRLKKHSSNFIWQIQKDDHIGATIAPIQAILCNSGCASWISITSYARLCPEFSIFLELPYTNVTGRRMLFGSPTKAVDAFKLIHSESWFSLEYPKKKYFNSVKKFKARDYLRLRRHINNDGLLTITRKPYMVRPLAALR
jgi:hypothetical protein